MNNLVPGAPLDSGDKTWDALCAEYERSRTIGPHWVDLVLDVCAKIAPKYPPSIYNSGIAWDMSSVKDLAQDVIVDRLLGAGQIHYIMASASGIAGARGLLTRHIKQVLVQRVIPNQRDNVADRLFPLFEKAGEAVPGGEGMAYRPVGSAWPPADPSDEAIKSAVKVVRTMPRLPNRGTDRLSPLFTTEVLEVAVGPLWEALNVPVTKRTLLRVLDLALTGMAPVFFYLDEDVELPQRGGLSVEEEVMVNDLAIGLVEKLTPEQREILVNIEMMTDSELAVRLGVSRPTALKRRHALRDLLGGFFAQDAVQDLSDGIKGAVLVRAQLELGMRYV